MSKTSFFLELDSESQQALSNNNLTIEDVLNQAGIGAEVAFGHAPYATETGTKELATIILASGVSAALVASGIARVLRVLMYRPRVVEISEVVEVRDSEGNVLTDDTGQPRFKRQKRFEMLQPHEPGTLSEIVTNVGGSNGMVITFRDSQVSGDHTSND